MKITHCFKQFVAIYTKPICSEPVNLLMRYCCVEAPKFTLRSDFSKKRHGHFLKNSRFVQTKLEFLQICIKLTSCVESSRHKLTNWVRVKLTGIYCTNRFAKNCELADVSLVSNNFMWKHHRRSSKQNYPSFWKRNFIASCGWINFCRQMLATIGEVHPNFSISIPLLW